MFDHYLTEDKPDRYSEKDINLRLAFKYQKEDKINKAF